LRQIVNNKTENLNEQALQNSKINGIRAGIGDKIKDKTPPKLLGLPNLTVFRGQTRAFLKVQDGCDGYCSYCIVPKARPEIYSKPIDEVMEEAQRLVEAGHKEIVVTGIFLGAYGQKTARKSKWDQKKNIQLPLLVKKLAQIKNLKRIRLSSLEPGDVTKELLDVFCNNANVMPHLHLSLQSGSDSILKKMCRQYRAEEFLETIEMIKERLDRPAITTDIIVGFPGETEDDFERTVELAKKIGFAKMHVFSFSARKTTAAAKMQGTVKNEVIKKRSQILHKLNDELAYKFRQQFVGEKAKILVENTGKNVGGRSERYFLVYIDSDEKRISKNDLVEVRLVENRENGMAGRIV
jgi:threonylcarbamoyladenosine tRNA methylthiotransferase MtaB